MKTSHLQSLIAQNANRITKLHNQHRQFVRDAAGFKNQVNVAPLYRKHVEGARITAFKAAAGVTKDIAKAVELQRALQAELRENRVREVAALTKVSRFFTSRIDWGNDAFCVELTPYGEYVVYCKDGSSRACNANWSHEFADVVEHTTRQYPVEVQVPGVYNISRDGQPKKDGAYEVMYKDDTKPCVTYFFEDGAWRYRTGDVDTTGFGNVVEDQQDEYYIVK